MGRRAGLGALDKTLFVVSGGVDIRLKLKKVPIKYTYQ